MAGRGDLEPVLSEVRGRVLSVSLRYPAVLLITFAPQCPLNYPQVQMQSVWILQLPAVLQSSAGDKRLQMPGITEGAVSLGRQWRFVVGGWSGGDVAIGWAQGDWVLGCSGL